MSRFFKPQNPDKCPDFSTLRIPINVPIFNPRIPSTCYFSGRSTVFTAKEQPRSCIRSSVKTTDDLALWSVTVTHSVGVSYCYSTSDQSDLTTLGRVLKCAGLAGFITEMTDESHAGGGGEWRQVEGDRQISDGMDGD